MLTNKWSWLASLGVGILIPVTSGVATWLTSHAGTPGGLSPLMTVIVTTVITKLGLYLTSLIPRGPNQATLNAERLVSWSHNIKV